jgi:hypothetical protein
MVTALDHYGFLKWMGDRSYLCLKSCLVFGKPFNLNVPKTFNEKLNWLKLNDRNPLYTSMADKYVVKGLIIQLGIEGLHTARCYGVWSDFDEINFDELPEQFVLKATHDSSGATVCTDKANFDRRTARKKFKRFLSLNNYWGSREWIYKDIPPRIIAEEYLDDGTEHELTDYKFWCFNGEPKIMYVTNKGKEIYENFYDMDFVSVPVCHGFPRRSPEYECPVEFQRMKRYAAELSKGIPFVRIDFFSVKGKVYFGEFTFYDWAGMRPFSPESWDRKLGEWICLPLNECRENVAIFDGKRISLNKKK